MSTNETTTMQAIVQDSYGNADVLRTAQIPSPSLAPTRCCCGCTRPVLTGGRGT